MPWNAEGPFPTLGWQVLMWAYEHLPAPDDDELPFKATDEQARLLLEWFRVDPESGDFVHRRGASRRSKGWGKSPVEAVKALAELCGPVRFDGWDARGEPVGRPWGTQGDPPPWVQIAAVSEDQTENTYEALYSMLAANGGKAAAELGIDEGRTRLILRERRGKLDPVTAAAGSREGQRVTYAIMDETHLWTPRNGGVKLARTLRRNVAKMGGRSYETTNAFVPGEESVAEGTHEAWAAGKPGILYDQVEAPPVDPDDDDATLKQALKVAYGDAVWVNLDRLVQEIRDQDTPWVEAGRFYFNWILRGLNKAVDPAQWRTLVDTSEVPAGTPIGVGFDGSETDDHTVMVGTVYGTNHQFVLGHWDPATYRGDEWRLEVHERVAEVFDRFRVGRMLCDVAKWRTDIETWGRRHGDDVVLGYPQTDQRMGPATERWLDAIQHGDMTWDGMDVFSQHVVAAHMKLTERKVQGRHWPILTKGPDRRKIDLAVAAVMSMEAAATMDEPAPKGVPLVAWR